MGSANLTMGVNGIDKTGAAFRSVKNRAAATSAQIRSMVGGAIGALGAYFSFRAVKGGIDELSHLSDVAQKTGTSVEELTKAATALSVLGIQNMGVDQLGKAFDYMAKSTGRTGMAGFYQTIEELGKIPDTAERCQAAIKVFGRSGMEFMPLVNAAKDGVSAFQAVAETMGGVSQQAAVVGDAVKDASDIIKNKFNNLWLEAIAAVARLFHGDIRGGAVAMGGYLEYGAKVGWRYLKGFFQNGEDGVARYKKVWEGLQNYIIRSMVSLVVVSKEWLKTIPERIGIGFGNAVYSVAGIFSEDIAKRGRAFTGEWAKELSFDMWRAVDKELKGMGIDATKDLSVGVRGVFEDAFSDIKTDDLEKKLERVLELAKKVTENMNNAAKPVDSVGNNERRLDELTHRQTRISNELILGGSNAATRLQLLGPTLQSETKKQTKLLEKIAANTEQTADNTEESAREEFKTLDA